MREKLKWNMIMMMLEVPLHFITDVAINNLLTSAVREPCYDSGCESPHCDHWGPACVTGQAVWELWWTRWLSFPLSVVFHQCSIFFHYDWYCIVLAFGIIIKQTLFYSKRVKKMWILCKAFRYIRLQQVSCKRGEEDSRPSTCWLETRSCWYLIQKDSGVTAEH